MKDNRACCHRFVFLARKRTVATTWRTASNQRRTSLEAAMAGAKKKRWIATVKTVSTFPPAGLFTKNAATIAKTLASKKVSPKGPGSGMRMLTYFINRAGRGLTAERRAELEKAKKLLSQRIASAKKPPKRKVAA